MKHLKIVMGLSAALAVSPTFAQVTIDNFESGLGTGWAATGYATISAAADGGANSTTQYLLIDDAGWGVGAVGTDLATPATGAYKFSFYYKNGLDANPISTLSVKLLQGSTVLATLTVPGTAQSAWTKLESSAFELSTADPVSIEITGNTNATANQKAGFDEFMLEALAGIPLSATATPDEALWLSGTETIEVTPVGGTGNYTVAIDIGNNGSVESTKNSAPYTYSWNTLTDVPQGTSRTLEAATGNTPFPVKITVSDGAATPIEIVNEYTVDNEHDGRVSLVTNGDFSQWQGTGTTANLPVGWVDIPTTVAITLAEYGPAPSYSTEAGNALRIIFGAGPSEPLDRYALRTEAISGNYRDLQASFWGRGTYCRLYYLVSTDGGNSFITSYTPAGQANSSTWTFAIQPTPTNNLDLDGDTTHFALGTHMLGTTEHLWDDVTLEGKLVPDDNSDVEGWNFY